MPLHFQRMVQGEGQSTGQPDPKKAPAPGGAKAKPNFRFLLTYRFSLRFCAESAMLRAKPRGGTENGTTYNRNTDPAAAGAGTGAAHRA